VQRYNNFIVDGNEQSSRKTTKPAGKRETEKDDLLTRPSGTNTYRRERRRQTHGLGCARFSTTIAPDYGYYKIFDRFGNGFRLLIGELKIATVNMRAKRL